MSAVTRLWKLPHDLYVFGGLLAVFPIATVVAAFTRQQTRSSVAGSAQRHEGQYLDTAEEPAIQPGGWYLDMNEHQPTHRHRWYLETRGVKGASGDRWYLGPKS
ncbi:MAG: hypothetical protein U0822_08565 [Anaerolineae bacterium]